ncbi:MAG: aminotransferase class V-fold PLP-dependent enzyme [Chloroflexi bacterium]|nr:MAG: putative aromatic amino acid decarboxylase [Chloroflexi bacterium OLB13]MBW7880478.1 aminotransferase class V-fold PLP-dependent enzyme [Anaerolineae bacterium]MCC6567233.1 aminotransferase class V-fold PLP-dependent enzyme [Chloroflexota bacterium]
MFDHLQHLESEARVLELSADQRHHLTREAVAYTERFYENCPRRPIYQYTDDMGAGILTSPISPGPIDIDEALHLLHRYVDSPGLNAAAPGDLAYIPAGGLYPAALGDYLSAVINLYTGIFAVAPGAVRLENMLLRWMGELVGYPADAAGNLTTGGSIANLTSVVTARDAHSLKPKDYARSVVYVSGERHHSIDKALRIAGFTEVVMREIGMDATYHMRPGVLAAQIDADQKAGLNPWLVVANAGATNTGAVDPLTEIGQVAHDRGLWFHVDGAYGAFFTLCEPGRERLRGIERSDSVIMDPHKSLFLPWGSGAVLIKDRRTMVASHHYSPSYLQDVEGGEELSPSDLSPELTRNFRGLRLWLPLKLFGTRPFAAALEEKMLLARYFRARLCEMAGFEVGPEPDLSVVLWRYVPARGDADAFNTQLVEAIKRDGRVFLSSTRIDGVFWIRLAALAYHTHKDTIDLAIDVICERVAAVLEAG